MPAGRYEKVLTSVLDDPTLTDAEARLIGHLATRPPGWVVIPAAVAKDIKRNERYWVRPTLRLLAARGFLSAVRGRSERGQLGSVTYRINRDELLARTPDETRRSEPSTVKQSVVRPAETEEEQESSQLRPSTVKQSVVRPAETQKASSDHGLSDSALSDNRRVRTDKEPRTEKTSSSDQRPDGDMRGTRPEVDRICDHLADRVERLTRRRPPINITGWLRPARYLLEVDKLTEGQVHQAIEFAHNSEFWAANIRSVSKLREKLPQLRAERDRLAKVEERKVFATTAEEPVARGTIRAGTRRPAATTTTDGGPDELDIF